MVLSIIWILQIWHCKSEYFGPYWFLLQLSNFWLWWPKTLMVFCRWRVSSFLKNVFRYQIESWFIHSVGCAIYRVHVSSEWGPCDLLNVLSLRTVTCQGIHWCWQTDLLGSLWLLLLHDDVINRKHFPRYWPLWAESTGHRCIPLTNARDAELGYFLWTHGWANNRDASDLRHLCAHYDVTVMKMCVITFLGLLNNYSDYQNNC